MKSESIDALVSALSKAQSEIRGAVKDQSNTYFKSSYADLASIWDACREPLTRNGLAVTQLLSDGDSGRVCVTTMLMHSSGQFVSSELNVKPVKPDPQSMGSAITYARRYSLAAIVGIPQVDDDGNAASRPQAEVKSRSSRSKGRPAPGPRDAQVMRRPTPPPAIGPDYILTAGDHRALTEAINAELGEDAARIKMRQVGRTLLEATQAQSALGQLDLGQQKRIAKVLPVAKALLVLRRARYVERAKALPADWRDGIDFDADKSPTETLIEAVNAYAIAAELPADEASLAPLFAAADVEPGPLWGMGEAELKALRKAHRKAEREAAKAVQA